MRKISTLLCSLLLLSLSLSVSAFEADFSAKIRGVNTENDDARVISTAHFEETNINEDGSFTVAYSLNDQTFSASIELVNFEVIDETDQSEVFEVKVGNANNGKITIKYYPNTRTGLIKTRFVKKVTLESATNSFDVSATSGDWNGAATITSMINTPEQAYPEQITLEGTITSTNFPYVINTVTVSVAGDVVYSGSPVSEDETNFSIQINTSLDSGYVGTTNDISVSVNGFSDSGSIIGSAVASLNPNQTSYDLGNIDMYLEPQ